MADENILECRLLHVADDPLESDSSAIKSGYEVFIKVGSEVNAVSLENWVKNNKQEVTEFVHLADGYCTAKIARVGAKTVFAKLRDQFAGIEIETVRFVRAHLDKSVERIYGWSPSGTKDLTYGKDVVIGIVDYGIDFTLEDFREVDDPSKTRIAYLWDQTLEAQDGESAPRYGYGVEYCSDQINRALKEFKDTHKRLAIVRHNPRNPEFKDIDGHGTHVAGIAAGNGQTQDGKYAKGGFVGVAPGSTLVFVNLGRPGMLDTINSPRGTLANSVSLAHAITYCFEKAKDLDKPCVVNLSMGFNGGSHDGNMMVERIIDALLQDPGRAVVVSAGNEDENKIYWGGRLKENVPVAITWNIGGDQNGPQSDPTPNEVEVWYSRDSSVSVCLEEPSSQQERSPVVAPSYKSEWHRFKEGETVSIASVPETPGHRDACIHIGLRKGTREAGIRAGPWQIILKATRVAAAEKQEGARFDAWIERTIPVDGQEFADSTFNDASNAITLTTPSTAESAITVAAFHNISGLPTGVVGGNRGPNCDLMWGPSGRGPTRLGKKKPDLAAPGRPVLSSVAWAGETEADLPRIAREARRGTSMAAPHVTGVVARLLSRNRDLTAAQIRKILVDSAAKPQGMTDNWDPKWGYGMVDAERAMQTLKALCGFKH